MTTLFNKDSKIQITFAQGPVTDKHLIPVFHLIDEDELEGLTEEQQKKLAIDSGRDLILDVIDDYVNSSWKEKNSTSIEYSVSLNKGGSTITSVVEKDCEIDELDTDEIEEELKDFSLQNLEISVELIF